MSDTALNWVAPFWYAPTSPPEHPRNPRVWILNPGIKSGSVKVFFFGPDGDEEASVKQPVGPKSTVVFDGPTTLGGWVRVSSDQPVAPWGQTCAYRPSEETSWLNMTFYRVDAPPPTSRVSPGIKTSGAKPARKSAGKGGGRAR